MELVDGTWTVVKQTFPLKIKSEDAIAELMD